MLQRPIKLMYWKTLYIGKGHLVAMHLKETVPGKFREIPYGTGHVNFEDAVEAAWQLGVRKYVAEFWYTGNPDWKNDLVFAHEMLSKILDKQQNSTRGNIL